MTVEIKPEDFGEWDIDIAVSAGGGLFADIADLMFHSYNASDGYYPLADESDVPAVIAEVRGHIERLESAIKKAKADIASIERPARLAAYRRQTREAK